MPGRVAQTLRLGQLPEGRTDLSGAQGRSQVHGVRTHATSRPLHPGGTAWAGGGRGAAAATPQRRQGGARRGRRRAL